MNEQIRQQYDSLYAQSNKTFGDGTPLALLSLLPELVPTGRVLDIGGGDGRNALALAKMGYEVSVVDLSSVGLEKATRLAQQEGLSIATHCADVTTEQIAGVYDVILFSFVTHHLTTEAALALIKMSQHRTRVGGTHLIAGFGNQGGLYERANKKNRFYPSRESLVELYVGWQILQNLEKETTTLAKNKQGERMKNSALFFMAQKQH